MRLLLALQQIQMEMLRVALVSWCPIRSRLDQLVSRRAACILIQGHVIHALDRRNVIMAVLVPLTLGCKLGIALSCYLVLLLHEARLIDVVARLVGGDASHRGPRLALVDPRGGELRVGCLHVQHQLELLLRELLAHIPHSLLLTCPPRAERFCSLGVLRLPRHISLLLLELAGLLLQELHNPRGLAVVFLEGGGGRSFRLAALRRLFHLSLQGLLLVGEVCHFHLGEPCRLVEPTLEARPLPIGGMAVYAAVEVDLDVVLRGIDGIHHAWVSLVLQALELLF